jgi:ParB-like chromosome segregation protein Spo0J
MLDEQRPWYCDLEVHWFAATFPLLSADELEALARDIAQNGQRDPVFLDHTGRVLLDGQNRLKACIMAGVEPRFERRPEGEDPIKFILSKNVERRHLNKGQQAIALVLSQPETQQGKRTDLEPKVQSSRIRSSTLSEAREIIAHQDLAERVMAGSLPLDHALGEARWRVENAGTAERYLRQLQADAPELAEAVSAGQMSLYRAVMEHAGREAVTRRNLRKQTKLVLGHMRGLWTDWWPGLSHDEGFRAGFMHQYGLNSGEADAAIAAFEHALTLVKGR